MSWARRPWLAVARSSALVTAALATLLEPAALAAPTYDLTTEIGSELDSNALRDPSSNADRVSSGLMRLTADGSVDLRPGRHRLRLEYGGGAKVFFEDQARRADELVHRASGLWRVRVGQQRTFFDLRGSFYDAFQRISERDFRTGTATAALMLVHPSTTVASLQLGYQGLEFKPDASYSFHSLLGVVGLSRELTSGDEDDLATWRLSLTYQLALRYYGGPVLGEQRTDPCLATDAAGDCERRRRDVEQLVRLSVDYLGDAAASFFYWAELNRSNSFGESFVRHAIGIKFTAPLVWRIFMTTKGVLQFSRYDDPFLLTPLTTSTFVSIDDENRSTLIVQLARDVTERWSLALRYSLYLNETTRGGLDDRSLAPGFLRHLLFFGARFKLSPNGG